MRLDCREPERIADVGVQQLLSDGASAWVTASGRAGHNRAMVWVQWNSDVDSGVVVSVWAGTRSPFTPGQVAFGQVAKANIVDATMFPNGEANTKALAIPVTIAPGADLAVGLTSISYHTASASLFRIWWQSWIEAE